MTANEMGNTMTMLLEAGGLTNKVLNSREQALFLNMAVMEFITSKTFANRNNKGEGHEDSKKRILEIAPLLTSKTGVYLKKRNISGTLYGDFVRGTYINGAWRNQDKDTELPNSSVGGNYDTAILTDAEDAKYGVLLELPSDLLYIATHNCDISIGTDTTKKWRNNVNCEYIKNEDYNESIYNMYKVPHTDLIWCREYGVTLPSQVLSAGRNTAEFRSTASNRSTPTTVPISTEYTFDGKKGGRILQLILPKSFELEKYNLLYIKKPNAIVIDYTTPSNMVDCELHNSTHFEIVQIAVRLASAALIPVQQKYQVQQIESKMQD